MNTEIQKSKVYVLLGKRNRVLRCEGGYTMSNIDDVSLILEKLSSRLSRAWVDGIATCKRLEPVGVIACKHVWADIVRDPMVRPCVKCGKEGGLRKYINNK